MNGIIKKYFNKERVKIMIITLSVFFVNYAADRISKIIAVHFLKGEQPIRLLNNIFILTYAENNGAFLSMGSNFPPVLKYILLLIVPLAVCFFGILWCLLKEKKIGRAVIITCITAGGFGNLVDRLFNNFLVIDFMNFGIGHIRTGILNVADLSVTFGALAFAVYEYLDSREPQKHIDS